MESVLAMNLSTSRASYASKSCSNGPGPILVYSRDAICRTFRPRRVYASHRLQRSSSSLRFSSTTVCFRGLHFQKTFKVAVFYSNPERRQAHFCKASVTNSRNLAVDPQPSGFRPDPDSLNSFDTVPISSNSEDSAVQEGSESAAEISDELWKLLVLVPEHIGEKLVSHPEIEGLVEIVLDLGRRPLARFPSGDWFISETKVTEQDLQHAISMVNMNLFVFFYLISVLITFMWGSHMFKVAIFKTEFGRIVHLQLWL